MERFLISCDEYQMFCGAKKYFYIVDAHCSECLFMIINVGTFRKNKCLDFIAVVFSTY